MIPSYRVRIVKSDNPHIVGKYLGKVGEMATEDPDQAFRAYLPWFKNPPRFMRQQRVQDQLKAGNLRLVYVWPDKPNR